MLSFGENSYILFIGYKDEDCKLNPLRIMLPKTSSYIKCYNGETKWMNFWIKTISWYLVINSIKNEFDFEPIYNKKCLKIKIISYSD